MANNVFKFHIGIDVSKTNLDVSISSKSTFFQVSNNEAGLKELIKNIPNKKRSLIVFEASGGYEKYAANYLRRKKCNVAVVNAKRVRDFAKAGGNLAKTDKIDARVIMEFGKSFNPTPQSLASAEEEKRLNAFNRRNQLVKMITLEKQHLEKASDEFQKFILKHIKFLEKELELTEKYLLERFDKDPILRDKLERLDGIKGVGKVTAMNILVYMPEIGQLTAKEVSALAGVAPFNKDSGQMRGRRIIRGGRAPIRTALYMAALSAKKSNSAIKRFYDRLIKQGKLAKVALVACMRKLIIVMNSIIRDNTVWEPR